MLTDQDLAHAISQAAAEYDRDIIGAAILIRDVRNAIRFFDSQPTQQVTCHAIRFVMFEPSRFPLREQSL